MTRLVRFADRNPVFDGIEGHLLDCFSGSTELGYFEDLERVCALYGNDVSVILLPEIPVAEITWDTPVWVVARPAGSVDIKIRRASINEMAWAIQKYSGGPVRVGTKGLKFSTSTVECFLSTSGAAFPGDADGVIVDEQNRVRCVVEYKKHTLSDALGNHLMPRYYPHPDGRKYQRLAALAARYACYLQQRVPLVVFYYSTKSPVIRLQEIGSLEANGVVISRDSGELEIGNEAPWDTSQKVVRWLEL